MGDSIWHTLRLPSSVISKGESERSLACVKRHSSACTHQPLRQSNRIYEQTRSLRGYLSILARLHSLSVIRHANAFGSDWTAALFITQVSLVGTLINNRAKWARQKERYVTHNALLLEKNEKEKKARAGRTSWCVRAATPVRSPLAAAGVEFYATRCALELAGRFSRLCQHFIRLHTTARQPCEEKLLRFSLIPTQKSTRPMERRRGGVEGGAGAATEATCCPRSPAPWIIVAIMRVMIDTRAGRRTNETTQKGAEFNSKEWSKTGTHFFTRPNCTF